MASIKAGLIFIWTGTNASIPSGWVRETALDSKYAKAWGISVEQNNTGGASTHAHSGTGTHSHTISAHTHTYTIIYQNMSGVSDENRLESGGPCCPGWHNHYQSTSGAVSTNTASGAATANFAAVSNDPEYKEVIFIKAQPGAMLEDGIVTLWSGWKGDTTVPTNYKFCDGTNSTVDLRNKFLKGAATSGNAGATGGSTTNAHDISHAHTAGSHNHANATSASANTTFFQQNGSWTAKGDHTHVMSFNTSSVNVTSYSGTVSCTGETVEPAYKKLAAIQKQTGGLKEKGIIGLWTGTTLLAPKGWVPCDGNNGTQDMRDKHLKIANTLSEIGNAGGSNTHTHTIGHTHDSPAHSHVMPAVDHQSAGGNYNSASGAGNYDTLQGDDVHNSVSTDTSTTTYASSSISADSQNNEPSYLTVMFMQYQKEVGGSAMLTLLMDQN